MVTDLFGNVPVLMFDVYVFKCFPLSVVSLGKGLFRDIFTYKHRVERFGDPAERRRIV